MHVCLHQPQSKYAEANCCQEEVPYGDDDFDLDLGGGVRALVVGLLTKLSLLWYICSRNRVKLKRTLTNDFEGNHCTITANPYFMNNKVSVSLFNFIFKKYLCLTALTELI